MQKLIFLPDVCDSFIYKICPSLPPLLINSEREEEKKKLREN